MSLNIDDLAMLKAASFDGKPVTGYSKIRMPDYLGIGICSYRLLHHHYDDRQIENLIDFESLQKDLSEVLNKYDLKLLSITHGIERAG